MMKSINAFKVHRIHMNRSRK